MSKKYAREIARLNARCDQTDAAVSDAIDRLTHRYGGSTWATQSKFRRAVRRYAARVAADAPGALDRLARRYVRRTKAMRAGYWQTLVRGFKSEVRRYRALAAADQAALDELFEAEYGFHPSKFQ